VKAAPIEGTDLPPLASLYKRTVSFDGKTTDWAGVWLWMDD